MYGLPKGKVISVTMDRVENGYRQIGRRRWAAARYLVPALGSRYGQSAPHERDDPTAMDPDNAFRPMMAQDSSMSGEPILTLISGFTALSPIEPTSGLYIYRTCTG